ncbi:hypothetical protein HYS54_05415 [Candidatus Micrarchaeota archaeon]|nr:hypothetical protein [Candidatus Micrarchaeota archaeon]
MEFDRSNYARLAAGAAVVVGLVLLLTLVVPSVTNTPTLRAYFEPGGPVRPESNTTLVVEVVNTEGADVRTLLVSAQGIDPTSVSVGDSPQSQLNVGKGELKKFRFPTHVGAAREGTYNIRVVADLDGKKFEQRASFEVKGGSQVAAAPAGGRGGASGDAAVGAAQEGSFASAHEPTVTETSVPGKGGCES